LGTGGSLALPIVGSTLKTVEANAKMRGRYVNSFDWIEGHAPDLDCAAQRNPDALDRLIDDVFGRDKPHPVDTTKDERRNVFDRLFKKKE
jgi:hypothetical protein